MLCVMRYAKKRNFSSVSVTVAPIQGDTVLIFDFPKLLSTNHVGRHNDRMLHYFSFFWIPEKLEWNSIASYDHQDSKTFGIFLFFVHTSEFRADATTIDISLRSSKIIIIRVFVIFSFVLRIFLDICYLSFAMNLSLSCLLCSHYFFLQYTPSRVVKPFPMWAIVAIAGGVVLVIIILATVGLYIQHRKDKTEGEPLIYHK